MNKNTIKINKLLYLFLYRNPLDEPHNGLKLWGIKRVQLFILTKGFRWWSLPSALGMDKQKVFVLKRCFRSLSFHANTRTGATNQLNDDDVAITVAQKEMLRCSMWLFFKKIFVTQLDCRLSSFFSRQTRNLQVQLCRKCVEVWQMLIAANSVLLPPNERILTRSHVTTPPRTIRADKR